MIRWTVFDDFFVIPALAGQKSFKNFAKNTGWEAINIIKVRNKIRVPQQMSGNQNLAGLYPEVFEQRTIHAWTFHKTKSLPSYKMAFNSKISGFRPLNPIDDKTDIIFMIIEPILSILLSIFCLPLNREGPNCWLNSFVSFLISKQILSPGLKSLKDAYNYRFCYCLLSAVGCWLDTLSQDQFAETELPIIVSFVVDLQQAERTSI